MTLKERKETISIFEIEEYKDFYVEVSISKSDEEYYDFHLCNKKYGVKDLMFGWKATEEDFEWFIKNNVEEHIAFFIKDHIIASAIE